MAKNGSSSNGFHVDDHGEMMLYKKDAISVTSFTIVHSKDDLSPAKTGQFKPTMAHQVFGDSESIFGYRSLSIHFYYLHNSARCYVDIQKSEEIKTSSTSQPDDIMESLSRWIPEDYTTDKEKFEDWLENEKHDLMFGTVIGEFKDKKECQLFPDQKIYANYKVTMCDLADKDFIEFHRRFESYIVWFIDAANFIDLDDERWMVFYVFEEFEHPETKKMYRSAIGFCSVYRFYYFPDNARARISQFFILPSHQKRGIGSKLYHTLVNRIREMPEVVDITVEEPTAIFQKLRDMDDCLTVYKLLKSKKLNICSGSRRNILKLMKEQKICKRQSQRVFDILGCYLAGKAGEEERRKYIESIRNRIDAEIERETRGNKRLCNLERIGIEVELPDRNVLTDEEFKRHMEDIAAGIAYLHQSFPDDV